jgi:hypothetical protein
LINHLVYPFTIVEHIWCACRIYNHLKLIFCEIKNGVPLGAVRLFRLRREPREVFVGLRFRQVALNTCHLLLKLVPHRLVDAADIELRCDVPDKAFEDTVKVLAPAFGSCLRAGHADQREPFRQHLGARARL